MRKISVEELLQRYAAGERDFSGIEIIRNPEIDPIEGSIYGLEEADLREINLQGANLDSVVLQKANLSGANLFGAHLIVVDLSSAILRDADLRSANMFWGGLNGADLTNARLDYANFMCARLIGAKIGGFEYAILADADFTDSNAYQSALCCCGNLIWNTTMPDGTVEKGPYYGDW